MNTSKVIDKKLRGGAESAPPPPVGIGKIRNIYFRTKKHDISDYK